MFSSKSGDERAPFAKDVQDKAFDVLYQTAQDAMELKVGKIDIYEELISKTSYIHSYMLLICRSGHSKEDNFQHKIYCKMENVDTNWNLE